MGLTIDCQVHGHEFGGRLADNGAAGCFITHGVVKPGFRHLAHFALARATSAALIPSNASPSVTPSSMIRRSFCVIASCVYLVVSGGSLASSSAISRERGKSLSAGTISLTAPHCFAV